MLYVFTVEPGSSMIIMGTQVMGLSSANILLFEYANQPAESLDGSATNITLSGLSSLQGDWAVILSKDVLPHLRRSRAWRKCKLVKHLADVFMARWEVMNFMAEQKAAA